jgi:hypothetical protein
MEEERLTRSPILEVNLRPVLYCDRIHVVSPVSFGEMGELSPPISNCANIGGVVINASAMFTLPGM